MHPNTLKFKFDLKCKIFVADTTSENCYVKSRPIHHDMI